MAVRIDNIESDVELQGDSGQQGEGRSTPTATSPALEQIRDLIEREARDDARTQAWDFDD